MQYDVQKIFTYHPPKDDQPKKYEEIRSIARDYAKVITDLCPDSSERSIALTKLDECVMWANASIARNE